MNLALVLPTWTAMGGTEGYAVGFARWLVSRGHEVHVYCLRAEPVPVDVDVHVLPAPPVPRPLRLAVAARQIRRDRHDIVQALGRAPGFDIYRAGGGVHAAWLDASVEGPLTWAKARLSPLQRVEARVDRAAARTARRVICNAERAAAEVRRWHGLQEDAVRVVRNGVDAGRFRPDEAARRRVRAAWGADGRVALFLGSGFRRKGLTTAARAFAVAAGPRDRLVVLGRDAHAARHLRVARSLLGDRLVVLGARSDPERWLPGADATILPTRYDPAANATLEAMACGVPPVTSARDGNSEVVPDPRLIVEDPHDVDGFATALRYAWDHRERLGEACRAEAERWPIARNGLAMEAIYRELTDG